MRKLRLCFPPVVALGLALGAAGCGGDQAQFEAGGIALVAQDEGYYYTTGNDYCPAAAHPGQLLLDWVDHANLCNSDTVPVDTMSEHTEFRIVLNVGVAPDWLGHYPGIQKDPYMVQPGSCELGGQGSSQAMLMHYAIGGAVDNTVEAQSGTVQFTQFSTDGSKPLEGDMNLTFNAGGKTTVIKKSFKLYACNPTPSSS